MIADKVVYLIHPKFCVRRIVVIESQRKSLQLICREQKSRIMWCYDFETFAAPPGQGFLISTIFFLLKFFLQPHDKNKFLIYNYGNLTNFCFTFQSKNKSKLTFPAVSSSMQQTFLFSHPWPCKQSHTFLGQFSRFFGNPTIPT